MCRILGHIARGKSQVIAELIFERNVPLLNDCRLKTAGNTRKLPLGSPLTVNVGNPSEIFRPKKRLS